MKRNLTKKSFLSLVLAAAMTISLLPQTILASKGVMSGDGSVSNPYLIDDAEDLKAFRDMVNGEAASKKCAKLMRDIDLKNQEWTPFNPSSGAVNDSYGGTFDGGNHTISGLKIQSSQSSGQGFFGTVAGAKIINLSVSGNITAQSSSYVGGIVGKTQGSVEIENCSFKGTVVGKSGSTSGAGGIVGRINNGSISVIGCVNNADITGGSAGGILGYMTAKGTTIENCYNTGNIYGGSGGKAGGIAGQVHNNTVIENCYNIGSIGSIDANNAAMYMGNISAFNNKSTKKCYYTGGTDAPGGSEPTETDAITKITDKAELLKKLGSAFVQDGAKINSGYPILKWQSGTEEKKNPEIEISGKTKLYITNDGTMPQTTLTVKYKDMDITPEVSWQIENTDVAGFANQTATENNSSVVLAAKKPGKTKVSAGVTYNDTNYTAKVDITVVPYITTVEIDGMAQVGKNVTAKVFTLGGKEYIYNEYPELTYQWKYISREDELAGEQYSIISGANSKTLALTENLLDCKISLTVWDGTREIGTNINKRVISAQEGEFETLCGTLSIDTSDIKTEKTLSLPKTIGDAEIEWASSATELIDVQTGQTHLAENGKTSVRLTATISKGNYQKTRYFDIWVYSKNNVENEIDDIINSLGEYYKIYPEWNDTHKDTNVIDIVREDILRHTEDVPDIKITRISERFPGARIAENGDITYYYTNPNNVGSVRFGQFDVTFELSRGNVKREMSAPVTIYWNRDRVIDEIETEIADKLSVDTSSAISESFTLPQYVSAKKWAKIEWISSDEDALSIGSAENNKYMATVRQSSVEKTVTLTAKITFTLTNDVTSNETKIILNKVFDGIKIAAADEEEINQARQKLETVLEEGLANTGICDAVSKLPAEKTDDIYTVQGDLIFPATRDFKLDGYPLDGKYYPVKIESDSENVITYGANSPKVEIIRPAVGKSAEIVNLTISITDKKLNAVASKTVKVKIMPLTREEIDSELELMSKAKREYFNGIKGENETADNISANLAPFFEVYESEGELVWVYASAGVTGLGIAPTAMEGWEELEAWRLFKSSNPFSVSHENLLVTIQNKAKAVQISSALSSERYGRYGKLYESDAEKYADYAELAPLYMQPVSADIVVRGKVTDSGSKPVPVTEKINVSFSLQNSTDTMIQARYTGLNEGTTAFDVFEQTVSENSGYSYKKRGSYIYSIVAPDGTEYSEKSDGAWSGWMYTVNGDLPSVAMGAYGLADGDDVVMFYTKDYTEVVGGGVSQTPITGGDKVKDDNDNAEKNDSENDKKDEITVSKFGDVKGHWAEKAIEEIVALGIMQGVGEDEFAPDDTLTRAMFVTLLYRLEKEPETVLAEFDDVISGAWYEKAVSWAKKNKIVSGTDEKEFGSDLPITREQAATIMYRYAEMKGYDTSSDNSVVYTDADDISEYARDAVAWASVKKIMTGHPDGSFVPKEGATRAQAAVILLNFIAEFTE